MDRKPEVLILSSRNDFSCDYVVAHLISRRVSYLRLNTEDLASYDVCLDPLGKELSCRLNGATFLSYLRIPSAPSGFVALFT
jgi:hypothetical protein